MQSFFYGLARQSLTAGWMILALLVLRPLLKKAPRAVSCLLWGLAAVRLVFPFSLESRVSLVPQQIAAPVRVTPIDPTLFAGPTIQTGAPAAAQVVSRGISWREVVPWVWLIGVAAMGIYALVSYLRLTRRVRASVRIKDRLYICDNVSSPFILGLFRPKIYLPSDLVQPATDYVLAHERAHLRRGDHLWKPLGYALLTVYWFNPLCWLAYILFCRDVEAACDEKVVRELGEGCKAAYSRALLACSTPKKLITACPLAFGETGVKARIRSVLNYKKPAFWLVLAAVLASVAVAVCFLTDPKREDPAQNPPAAEEAAAQAPAQTIDASSAPEPAIDEQAGLDPDFFTGTDGYGNSVTVQALFTAATEAGGNWGAYLPATGWLQEPGRSLWCSEQTGAAFEVGYLPDVPVSSRRHAYAAQGYAEQLLERCTVFTLDTGEENTLLYLYAAETGCYEVRIRWAAGEAQADASGYDAARQAHFDAQLLQQIAASFTPLNADGTAQTRFLLAQADIYTLYTQTEAVPCPYGDAGCQLHSASSLYCETDGVDGERLLDGPRTDTTYWFMHNDAAVGFLRLGFLVQTPAAHGGQFSQGYIDVTVPELRAQAYVSLENYSLSAENPAAPETVGTDSSMPIQPCELTLPNGVYLGLDYETTMQLAQAYRGSRVYRGQTPGDNFTVDGVSYYFSADSSGVLRLDSYSVITTELATQSFLRGIKLGDGLQSVLDTIPTADWQPEELYSQLLYGEDLVSGDRAVLDWNSSIYHPSYYTLIIKSGADSANIKFDHDGSVSGIYVSNY